MADYHEIAHGLPRPTVPQVEDFIDHVTAAHSWYKHLPLIPPGVPFVFFLDPNAGQDLVIRSLGLAKFRERTNSARSYHYSLKPTREYLERFGHLQFWTPAGTYILVGDPEGVLCNRLPWPAILAETPTEPTRWDTARRRARKRLSRPVVQEFPQEVAAQQSVLKSFAPPQDYIAEDGWLAVPEEVLEAGLAELTAAIHPETSKPQVLQWHLKAEAAKRAPLAQTAVLDSARLAALWERSDEEAKREVKILLDLEKNRQKKIMRDAILQMLEVVYGSP